MAKATDSNRPDGNPSNANDINHAAMQRMAALRIDPTPKNYTVWYSYYEGSNIKLKRAIDLLDPRPESFSPQKNEELYARFFGSDSGSEALRTIGDLLQNALTSVLSDVDGAGIEAAKFTEFLTGVTGKLESADALHSPLRELVREMVRQTRHMRKNSASLESQLKAASEEMEVLRRSLDIVRHEAMTDGLTGLANRKFFDHIMRREMIRSMEEGTELSLLLLDIDHFKQFNDNYGHQLGDQVLRVVAKAIVEVIPASTVAARYGGEEFAVVYPGGTLRRAMTLGEVVRDTVASKKIVRKATREELGNITMTIGVASFMPGESQRHLIDRADEALYRGKQAGRNRVVEARPVSESRNQPAASVDADIV